MKSLDPPRYERELLRKLRAAWKEGEASPDTGRVDMSRIKREGRRLLALQRSARRRKAP